MRSRITAHRAGVAALAVVLTLTGAACAGPDRPAGDGDPLVVSTTGGTVRGVTDGATRVFSGIPYAEPPVGTLRWAPPQPAAPWDGVRDATTPGPMCVQDPIPGAPQVDEDCLSVNVTVPADTDPGDLPVMVWLHGGGFTRDAGSLYGARRLAERGGVVVVTVNYRLGALGYLSLPGLAGSGSFGIADQIAALRWVRDNAAAFGGDQENVTVFGQSAGGASACALLTSPDADGLIDRAIMMSGNCGLDWPAGALFPGLPASTPYLSPEQSQALGATVVDQLGCTAAPDAVACLRDKPAGEFAPLGMSFTNSLGYGEPVLPGHPIDAVRAGDVPRVPMMIGNTRYEQRAQVGGAAPYTSFAPDRYEPLLREAFGDRASDVAREYPLSDYESSIEAWAVVTTDSSWACDTLRTAEDLSDTASAVYQYEFDVPGGPNVNGFEVPGLSSDSAHASDLPSLFTLLGQDLVVDPAQRELADQMVDLWTTFARTGDPNSGAAALWPRVDGEGLALRLTPGAVGVIDVAAEHHCDLWADIDRR